MKYMIFLGMTIGSYAGWWLGEQFASDVTDITWPFIISGVGTIAGVVIGWKLGKDL